MPIHSNQRSRRLHIISCHVLWREFSQLAAASPHVFDYRFLPQGLHNTPSELRSQLQQAIDTAPVEAEAILIGYGLCSNGVEGITARDKPLVVIRAHDCITFLLGSKERYREYFDSHPGTYWYTPGWIDTSIQPGRDRHDLTLRQYVETYGEENAAYLMGMEQAWMSNYNNAAYVDLGIAPSEAHQAYTHECAAFLNWNCDVLKGDPTLMRDMMEGEWDASRFLVVQPGQTIHASYDESTILRAE